MRQTTPTSLIDELASTPAIARASESLASGTSLALASGIGSSVVLTAGVLARNLSRTVILAVAHLDEADDAVDELISFGITASRLPALEILPGDTAVAVDLLAERLSLCRAVIADPTSLPQVLICPIQALMQAVPAPARLDEILLTLTVGNDHSQRGLIQWLADSGYKRLDSIEEPGDFAVRGGIVDIFPPGSDSAVRLDFFGDRIETITEIDLDTMGSAARLPSVSLVGASVDQLLSDDRTVPFLDLLPRSCISALVEPLELIEQGRGYYERASDARAILGPPAVMKSLRERFHARLDFVHFSATDVATTITLPASTLPEFSRDASEAVAELGRLAADHDVRVFCQNDGEAQRLSELIAEFAGGAGAKIESEVAFLHRGFIWNREERAPLLALPYHELLHRFHARRRLRRLRTGKSTDTFFELQIGDYVVHQDHGIAKFVGLKTMKPSGPKATANKRAEALINREDESAAAPTQEYLTLEFAGRTKLHVPVEQADKVQRYIGGFHGKPPLSTLGGSRWQTQKEKVKDSVRDLAAELLRIHAAREHSPGIAFPSDTPWQKEFEAAFPYQETEDQLAALAEIKKDMGRSRPMDRLLCGDVGYGKTELAIRAAFKAVEFGKQVAVLVPTTILAEQHEQTFRARFADYPFVVESLSRFKTKSEQNDVLMRARKGQVDILIGTHRLLSQDVRFADLGLVVVDEEQRFGVEHKQALLRLRLTADVLTLSATPIPRTLHMSMLGLRDISSLTTPPLDRRAVVTEVIPYNTHRVKQAIQRELAREGQVFFVHNRVHDIKSVADDIYKLAPDAKILIGHGQMSPEELEDVMTRFIRGQADILVSTTIIESGIDIPNANTMIIHNADTFGLADLHQLRGRVGRYKHRAYCYLLMPEGRPVTEVAARRLKAIEEYSMLGAGFKIAMRDLEIRGAGNLLGPEQSGHIATVGYDLYCRLLDQAARELQNESTFEPSQTTVEIGVSGMIPKNYIPGDARRLEAYRRIASARTPEELSSTRTDLAEAYTAIPESVERLFDLAEVRLAASRLGVRSIAVHERDVVIRTTDPGAIEAAFKGVQGTVRTLSARDEDGFAEVYFRPPESYLEPITLLRVLHKRLVGAPTIPATPRRS